MRWFARGRRAGTPSGAAPAAGTTAAAHSLPREPGIWERLTADSTTTHRRLLELAGQSTRSDRRGPGTRRGGPAGRPTGSEAPDEVVALLARAVTSSGAARERIRRDAAAGSALSPDSGMDLPHDGPARALYDNLAVLVGAQRNALYRVSLLTVPAPTGEHRFLLAGLRRAVTDLETRATPWQRVGRPSGPH